MRKILFPRPQRLARSFLQTELAIEGKTQPVSTKNPPVLPSQWVRLRSQGGPQNLYEWRCMLNVFVCAKDEVVAEENSNLIHSLMLQVPGVAILVPDYVSPYPWIRLARHISGPTLLDSDEDLPSVSVYRSVCTWHILPIPS